MSRISVVWWCILALGAAMILYTEEGGVIATIWAVASLLAA